MTLQTRALQVPAAPEGRQTDILDAVREAFVEKGFDGASMQDLARAAGMSVGNFYRYFDSKDAIVEALIRHDLTEIERDFAIIIKSENPLATLRETLHQHVLDKRNSADSRLWAEITAVAARKERVAKVLHQLEDDIHRYLLAVFAHVTGTNEAAVGQRYGGHASLIILLVKASSMCSPIQPVRLAELGDLVMRTINHTLDEIETDAAKG